MTNARSNVGAQSAVTWRKLGRTAGAVITIVGRDKNRHYSIGLMTHANFEHYSGMAELAQSEAKRRRPELLC